MEIHPLGTLIAVCLHDPEGDKCHKHNTWGTLGDKWLQFLPKKRAAKS